MNRGGARGRSYLKEPDELGDPPAQLSLVRLHQDQLDHVDDQEPPRSLVISGDHHASNQVAVI